MASPPIRQFLSTKDGSTSLSVTTDSGTLSTDLLVVVHYDDYGVLTDMGTPSSGTWTLQASSGSAPHGAIKAWTKPAVGGAETVTVTQTGNGRSMAVWVLENAVIDGVAASGAAYSKTQTAPSVSPTGATDLLLRVWGSISFATGTSYTVPSGYTADVNTNFDGATGYILAAHTSLAVSGATGTQAATGPAATGDSYNTVALAFTNAGPPPATASGSISLGGSTSVTALTSRTASGSHSLSGSATASTPASLTASGSLTMGGSTRVTPIAEIVDTPTFASSGLKPSTQGWQLFYYVTRTGQVLGEFPIAQTPTYAYGPNNQGSLSVQIPIGGNGVDKAKFDRFTYPWLYSVALCWRGYPLQAGPIVSDTFQDQGTPLVTLNAVGLWALFTRRALINPSVGAASVSSTAGDSIYTNLTLRQLAKNIILDNESRASTFDLPIDFEDDDPDGTETITYFGYDLNTVSDILTNITSTDQGCELEFKPYFSDPQTIRHKLRAGNPALVQDGSPWTWDVGGRGACVAMDYSRDGTNMTNASYVKAAGNAYTTIVGLERSTSADLVDFPALEMVDTNYTSAGTIQEARAYATADVNTNQYPFITFSAYVTLDGRDSQGNATPSPDITRFSSGDNVVFQVQDHIRIPDGTYSGRVVGVQNKDDLSAQLTIMLTNS